MSYRHLMVWSGGESEIECAPPHDILGKDIADYLPVGPGEEIIRELMINSVDVLESHEVNRERTGKGKNPANSIWLWGQGKKPSLSKFRERYSIDGALVSAVDLTKGLGIYAGFEILQVPGITGWLDTNYTGKAEAALKALEKVDFVYIHVEAPDEAGHSGNYKDKIKAIEDFDALVVGTVMKGIEKFKEYRILLMPDHATPIELRTHTGEPVPFVIFDSRYKKKNEGISYDESITKRKNIVVIEEGYKLMDYFIKGGPGVVLIVQKYGGTSVANIERIKNVAARVARTAKEGHRVVVVVSAMSGETDKLINLAHQASSNPNEREMDMLLSSGERVTSALTAMAIEDLGCKAMALTGRQMGIITDDVHTKARIAKITGDRAKKCP